MNRTALALAGVLALTVPALAAGDTTTKSPGASGHAPGQQMKNDTTGSTGSGTTGSTTSPGASGNAPGQQMKNDASGSGSMNSGSSTTGSGTSR